MPLFAFPVEYEMSSLDEWVPLESPGRSRPEREELTAFCISSAPPGKHALAECARYEEEWREHAAEVLAELKGDSACVLWAAGPFTADGLLPVVQHVDRWNDAGMRYHIDGFSYPGGRGYFSSWVSFEFEFESFRLMMRDKAIDFEEARLAGVICDPGLVGAIVGSHIRDLGLRWILEHRAVALAARRHFEGVYISASPNLIDAAMSRVRSRFGC